MSGTDPAAAHAAALAFLNHRIDYERAAEIPYHTRGFQLERMRDLLRRLGDPQDSLRIVHVAGTKGKGSTAAMISAVLTAAGYRTGLFSSPHLDRVEERLAIDGKSCAPEELVRLIQEIEPIIADMDRVAGELSPPEPGPTYFEITTALGLWHYQRQNVHTAVLEVGMGGRLDSTNIVKPDVVVITSISFDHTKQLGNTLTEIAREKAGIIKPGVPVISGVSEVEPQRVISEKCAELHSPLMRLGHDFKVQYYPPRNLERHDQHAEIDFSWGAGSPLRGTIEPHRYPLPLLGAHQGANAAVAIATIDQLQQQGWSVPREAIHEGFTRLRWPARVEVVRRQPAVVLDVAHNVASVEALLQVLAESFDVRRRQLIFATSKDKDLSGMLQRLLPSFDQVILTQFRNNTRAAPVEELAAVAQNVSSNAIHFEVCADLPTAWNLAKETSSPEDLICIAGSFFLAAEMREILRSEGSSD